MTLIKMQFFLFLFFLFFSCNNPQNLTTEISDSVSLNRTQIIEKPTKISFAELEAKYATLIPILDGLFITYDRVDSLAVVGSTSSPRGQDTMKELLFIGLQGKNVKKWGIIDSLGHVIVPFICDAIKQIDESSGVVSIYSHSYSLNTGIPRYMYFGNTYFFNNQGLLKGTNKSFSIQVVFQGDEHDAQLVISQGPNYFLPQQYKMLK
jgi:hypothetical protein